MKTTLPALLKRRYPLYRAYRRFIDSSDLIQKEKIIQPLPQIPHP